MLGSIIILLSHLLSAFVHSAFALPTNTTSPIQKTPVVCLGPQSSVPPPLSSDCAAAIVQIHNEPHFDSPVIWQRTTSQSAIVHKWYQGTCKILLRARTAEALDFIVMSDVARGAENIVAECVVGREHMGGSMVVGLEGHFEVVVKGKWLLAKGVKTEQVQGGGSTALENPKIDA